MYELRAIKHLGMRQRPKKARVARHLLVQLLPMVQDRSTPGPPRVTGLRLLGKAALRLSLVSHLEDLVMSTTRGVLYIHSAPSALCPHIEWAVGGVFGMPVRVDWIPQPIERACYRTEYSWTGPCGIAARLASALKGWQRIRFEVTEEATSGTEGERYSYTPTLGIFHAITGIHGDIMIPEDRIKHAMRSPLSGPRISPTRCTPYSAAPGTRSWNPSATPATGHRSAGCTRSSKLPQLRRLSAQVVAMASIDADKSELEGDVGVRPAFAGVGLSNRIGQGRSGRVGGHDLVHHTDLDRLLHTTGDALVLGGELGLELGAYVVGDLGQLAPMAECERRRSGPSQPPRLPAMRRLVAPSERAFIAMYAPP